MEYTRQYQNRINFRNAPSTDTPLNATNLNKIDKALNYIDEKMEEVAEGGGGASALTDLTDTNITNPANGQVLGYNSTSGKWENKNESGTNNYNDLSNKPQVNGVILSGNKSLSDIGVEANPSGTASTALEKLKIGSTTYSIPASEEGGKAYSFNIFSLSTATESTRIFTVHAYQYYDKDGLFILNTTNLQGSTPNTWTVRFEDTRTSPSPSRSRVLVDPYLNNYTEDLEEDTALVVDVDGQYAVVRGILRYDSTGGVTSYNDLTNKPQINSVTLTGNKSFADLGLAVNPSDTASGGDITKLKVDGTTYSIPSGGGLPETPLSTAHGGTGNTAGYIRTGQKMNTTAGQAATIEGENNTGSGTNSHAEGANTTASNVATHSEGTLTTASGSSAHSENYGTTASGNFTHAGGLYTSAGYEAQTAIGKYNDNKSGTLFEVGNGSESGGVITRSNAFEVYSNGDVVASGEIKDASGNKYAKGDANGILGIAKGGTGNSVGYIQTGLKENTTAGTAVTIEGASNTVTGARSHAEGYLNTISGQEAHAEGNGNTVSANYAHAEGYDTVASNTAAHSEGNTTTASGQYSHAGGSNTVAGYEAQTAIGKWNDNKNNTLFEVGSGSGSNYKYNAFEVRGSYNQGRISTDNGDTLFSFSQDINGNFGYFVGGASSITPVTSILKKRYFVLASLWSNSVDEDGYYTYSITLSPKLKTDFPPEVFVAGADDDTFPTDTENEMFDLLDGVKLLTNTSLKLYAKTKPTSTFDVFIKGAIDPS